MFVPPFTDPEMIKRLGALRRELLMAGASIARLEATPADLARHDLPHWDGLFCGIRCVDSRIEVVPK